MSWRFLLYLTLLLSILPLVFWRPFFGLCVYYVVSLLQPKLLCWREEFQDALIVGVPFVMGALAIGTRRAQLMPKLDEATRQISGVIRRIARSPLLEPGWPIALCFALVAYIGVTRLMAPYPLELTSTQYRSLCKVILVATLLTGLISDSKKFRTLFLVVALASAFWAIKGGLKVITLGPHQVHGKSYDNNLFALTSVMTLPMVFYFGLSVRHARWRAVLLVCAALMCLGIIGSRSRAGFVAFGVVLLCMAWSSRYRLRAIFAVVLVVSVAAVAAREEVSQRIDSILAYRQDRSARSRFYTWEVAQVLFKHSPVIGVGFNNFETARQRLVGGQKAAHNIFLQNLSELGLLGHPLWLGLILGTMISLYRFMRRARRLPPDMRWSYYCARGLLLGMTAYCIHGFFHNEEYLELMFAMVALTVALKAVTRRELAARRLCALIESHRTIEPDASGTISTEGPGLAPRPSPMLVSTESRPFSRPWR